MLSTDYVLVTDKSFKKYAKSYADNQDLWFKEFVVFFKVMSFIRRLTNLVRFSFSKAVATLFELGVPAEQFVTPEPWIIPTVDEQAAKKEEKK